MDCRGNELEKINSVSEDRAGVASTRATTMSKNAKTIIVSSPMMTTATI